VNILFGFAIFTFCGGGRACRRTVSPMVGGSRAPRLNHRSRASRLSPPKLLVAIRDTHPKVRMGSVKLPTRRYTWLDAKKFPTQLSLRVFAMAE
jgi:hypothetical protein